ncbi:MAG: hypothetical protein EXR71_13395 [Myxococcales bacterium]|nr:hypothetical protein [Myxococcales bacterium]
MIWVLLLGCVPPPAELPTSPPPSANLPVTPMAPALRGPDPSATIAVQLVAAFAASRLGVPPRGLPPH